jgi:hypothetical protein
MNTSDYNIQEIWDVIKNKTKEFMEQKRELKYKVKAWETCSMKS